MALRDTEQFARLCDIGVNLALARRAPLCRCRVERALEEHIFEVAGVVGVGPKAILALFGEHDVAALLDSRDHVLSNARLADPDRCRGRAG